jgi:hypothetical protein
MYALALSPGVLILALGENLWTEVAASIVSRWALSSAISLFIALPGVIAGLLCQIFSGDGEIIGYVNGWDLTPAILLILLRLFTLLYYQKIGVFLALAGLIAGVARDET